MRAFLDFWVALRGTVTVAAQRAGGRTRALVAAAAVALLVVVGVTAMALVGGDGTAGRPVPGGSDADAAALPVPDAGAPDVADAEPAQPSELAQPEPGGAASAPGALDDGTIVSDVPVTSGEPPEVAPDSAAEPVPGTSVTSTPTTVPPTTATTAAPPQSDGLLETVIRLLGKG